MSQNGTGAKGDKKAAPGKRTSQIQANILKRRLSARRGGGTTSSEAEGNRPTEDPNSTAGGSPKSVVPPPPPPPTTTTTDSTAKSTANIPPKRVSKRLSTSPKGVVPPPPPPPSGVGGAPEGNKPKKRLSALPKGVLPPPPPPTAAMSAAKKGIGRRASSGVTGNLPPPPPSGFASAGSTGAGQRRATLMTGDAVPDAATDSYRARLEAFYLEKNPAKLASVTTTLTSFKGHEEDLFTLLVDKYGPSTNEKGAAHAPTPEAGEEKGSQEEQTLVSPIDSTEEVAVDQTSEAEAIKTEDSDLEAEAQKAARRKAEQEKQEAEKNEEDRNKVAAFLQNKARQNTAIKEADSRREARDKKEEEDQHKVAIMLQGKARQKLAVREADKRKELTKASKVEDAVEGNEQSASMAPPATPTPLQMPEPNPSALITPEVKSPSSPFKTHRSAEQLLADEHMRELEELRERQATRTIENSAAMMFQGVMRGIHTRRQLHYQVEFMDDVLHEVIVEELSQLLTVVCAEEKERVATEIRKQEAEKLAWEKANLLDREEKSAMLMQKHSRSFLAKKKVAGIYENELRKTMKDFEEATGGLETMTFTQALEYHDVSHWIEDGSLSLPNFLSVWKSLPEKFQGDSINFEGFLYLLDHLDRGGGMH